MIHPYEGMPLSEFFGDESVHSQVLDAHYNALGGHAQSFEIEIDGAVFRGMVEPLFNAEWNLIGTVGNALEITSRRDAELERLRQFHRQTEADRRQALSNLAAGITQHFGRLFSSVSAYSAIIGMGLPGDHPGPTLARRHRKGFAMCCRPDEQLLCPRAPGLRHNEEIRFTHLIRTSSRNLSGMLSKKIDVSGRSGGGRRNHRGGCRRGAPPAGEPGLQRRHGHRRRRGHISLRTQVTKGPPWPTSVCGQDTDSDLPEGEYIWLQVSDTGRGLDDDARSRIFEPFAGFSGRGLGMVGLAIVSALHGSLSISSKPGLGTTCHVFLPILAKSSSVVQAPECFF